MKKAKLEARKQSDAEILAAATAIKNAMTTNAAEFPNSAATVTALGTALTAFGTALQAYVDGKATQEALTAAKDNARAAMETVLRVLVDQVNAVAQGDVEIIHDAAMQENQEPAPVMMTQVMNLQIEPSDHEGELLAKWDPVRGVAIYDVQICTDVNVPLTNWVPKLQTRKAKCSLNDTLVSGQKVWTRVRAIGANNTGAWSDPAQKTVP